MKGRANNRDMADKTGVAPKSKAKPKVQYEMVVDETGALVRRPVTSVVAPPPPPSTTFRPSITTAAVAASTASRAPINEEELVFNESGEELTGEARAKAQAELAARLDEEELVFDESGEELTGEARAEAQAQSQTQAQAQAQAQQEQKEEEAPVRTQAKPRKLPKNVATFQEVSDKEKVKIFYRYRQKYPKFFGYTAEGNLEIKADNPVSLPATVIPMRAFSGLEPEEEKELEDFRGEIESGDNERYVVLLNELRKANEEYNPEVLESIVKIVRLNKQLQEILTTKTNALYPERWTKQIENPTTSDILLNQPYEERKMGFDVYIFKRNVLSRNDAEGHYRAHGVFRPGGMGGGNTVVLFITNPEDQQTGIYHPATEKEFVYNETKYASPYQAYEVERFKLLEDEGMVKKLLGTRSAKTIRSLVSQEKEQPQNPVKLWEEILEALYTQAPELAKKLKETGSARFHMMDKLIGMPEYAVALANVRTKLKESENDAPANIDSIKQSVISEEEQKKAKVGAIINNFRR
jgi:hypothetical protein